MNKGFVTLGFAAFLAVAGILGFSGTVTVEKIANKKLAVEVQAHPEQLKTGVAEYNFN